MWVNPRGQRAVATATGVGTSRRPPQGGVMIDIHTGRPLYPPCRHRGTPRLLTLHPPPCRTHTGRCAATAGARCGGAQGASVCGGVRAGVLLTAVRDSQDEHYFRAHVLNTDNKNTRVQIDVWYQRPTDYSPWKYRQRLVSSPPQSSRWHNIYVTLDGDNATMARAKIEGEVVNIDIPNTYLSTGETIYAYIPSIETPSGYEQALLRQFATHKYMHPQSKRGRRLSTSQIDYTCKPTFQFQSGANVNYAPCATVDLSKNEWMACPWSFI